MNKSKDYKKLANGAKDIKKAEAEAKAKAATVEPIVIPESTRPIQDIIAERVTVLPGHIGLELADNTPIEENLRVLDWVSSMSDHVGFMIGDVLNSGNKSYGEKYTQALNQTGRAKATLQEYASVAARIPANQRQAALGFEAHRLIARLRDVPKIQEVLKEVGRQAKAGNAPTVKELRIKVGKLTPRKKKPSTKITSGKGKKKKSKRPDPPPYEPTPTEQAKMDSVEDNAKALGWEIEHSDVFHIVAQLDNKEKNRWLDIFHTFVVFYNNLAHVTGY